MQRIAAVVNPMVAYASRGHDVLKLFAEKGVWIRSIQMKNCQCLTAPTINFDASTRDVGDLYSDCWSFAHAKIAQSYFQLAPQDGEDGKRAFGLIVDWGKTAERYVDYSLKDASSNKTFPKGTQAKTPQECEADMNFILQELKGKKIDNNEVRTCQIRKEALIGLIWGPIKLATPLSDGKENWNDTKYKFVKFVQILKDRGVATSGIPIFQYRNSEYNQQMEYIDFIA